MPDWSAETNRQRISRLRAAVEQVRIDLIEAEAELADRMAEVNAFELEFEARAGYLMDQLVDLEAEIDRYTDLIETLRNRQVFGNAYLSAERQYQRAWEKPDQAAPVPPPQPPSPGDEAQIKKLYHQLARRFHPDLAADEADRLQRTEKMAAVNDAYAARSLTELQALAQASDPMLFAEAVPPGQTEAQMIEALEKELGRCHQRLKEIRIELRNLGNRPSVRLSLQVKLARKRGKDLLAEIAAELRQRIAQKTAERDLLKTQVDALGPDQGFIPIKR